MELKARTVGVGKVQKGVDLCATDGESAELGTESEKSREV